MRFVLESPTKIRIIDPTNEELAGLRSFLSFQNTSVAFQIKNLKKNRYMVFRFGEDYVNAKLDELKKQLTQTLLYTDDKGLYTLSGLADTISKRFKTPVENTIVYPEFELIPWANKPKHEMYDYQKEAVEALLSNPHAHVSMATGVGKTFSIVNLIKKAGLPTIISTPSTSIARQFYEEMTEYFGKKYVGLFGDGKKEIGKHFLICIGKSLASVEDEETKQKFKKYQVFISDESHTLGAELFAKFALDLLAHAPYRWFFSATQERNDGKDLLLEGIIGREVYSKTIQDAIKEGYLAKLSTLIFDVNSKSSYNGDNIIKNNQHHLYKNKNVLELVAKCATQAINTNQPVLILIDEHEQEALLRNYLGFPYAYAHGGSDVHQICKDFNDGKIMCVIGTSAVATGTNFKPVRLVINFKGNKAGTKVKQGAIGRATRIDERTGKKECRIVDFRVTNVPLLERHANIRISYYKEVGEVNFIDATGEGR